MYIDANKVEEKKNKLPMYQGFLAYFPRALQEVARVSQYGAKKHNGGSYKNPNFLDAIAYPKDGYADAVLRHLVARHLEGEVNYQDGQCFHLAQVAWNALAALEQELRHIEDMLVEVDFPDNYEEFDADWAYGDH